MMRLLFMILLILAVSCNTLRECPDQYEPVCGVDNVTYSNICYAEGVEVVHIGQCLQSCRQDLECNNVLVCGSDKVTYKDNCIACSSGVDSWSVGACLDYGVQQACEGHGGNWIGTASECESISEQDCLALGGVYDECGSACRHDPAAELCTLQCVQVCSISS